MIDAVLASTDRCGLPSALPKLIVPGLRDIRGYRAMYRDFVRSIRTGRQPEMSLERAIEDQRLMDQVYATVDAPNP